MKTIVVPAKEQVSAEAQVIFEQIQKKLGKVPNLYATIGYSADALKAFLGFDASFTHTAFTEKEKEAINLIVSEVNNCNYCLAAHTMLATMKGYSKEDTLEFRRGNATDAKLDTAVKLAKSIAENKGNADARLKENFFNAGYDEKALIDLIGLITVRSFTNYVYATTRVPIDFPLTEPLN